MTYNSIVRRKKMNPWSVYHTHLYHLKSHLTDSELIFVISISPSWWSTLLLSELGKNTQDAPVSDTIIVSPALLNASFFLSCYSIIYLIPCGIIIFCMFTVLYPVQYCVFYLKELYAKPHIFYSGFYLRNSLNYFEKT